MSGPAVASSNAALSRTERVRACSRAGPFSTSPTAGPGAVRARVVFNPKTPQHDAGIRIEPPPSLPWAIGTIPADTAAADPPLEPPVVRVGSQGLRLGPKRRGSVVGKRPDSGVLGLPGLVSPARLSRTTNSLSWSDTKSRRNAEPAHIRVPAYEAKRSFRRNGTPRNG